MERLTKEKQIGPFAALKDEAEAVPGAFGTYDCLYAHMIAVTRLKEYEDSMALERVQELAQAEKDGRLMVLPVPVGTGKVAYGLSDTDYGPQRIVTIECDQLEKLEIWDNPGNEVVVEVDGWEIGKSDIGKTVFLTRKEAEAALKKREADNEAD